MFDLCKGYIFNARGRRCAPASGELQPLENNKDNRLIPASLPLTGIAEATTILLGECSPDSQRACGRERYVPPAIISVQAVFVSHGLSRLNHEATFCEA
jgi:hypothetical protein